MRKIDLTADFLPLFKIWGWRAIEMSGVGIKTKPSTTIKTMIINQFSRREFKDGRAEWAEDAQAKVKWRTKKVKIKEYSSQDKSGMVCHMPTLWAFMNCNRKKSSFKKFKTLGILELRIKYTSNQEKFKTFLRPYQNSSLYL